jgi:hypothetical protein
VGSESLVGAWGTLGEGQEERRKGRVRKREKEDKGKKKRIRKNQKEV